MYAQPFIFKSCQKQRVNLWVFGVFQKGIKETKKERKKESQPACGETVDEKQIRCFRLGSTKIKQIFGKCPEIFTSK